MNKREARQCARDVYPQCPLWLCDICAGKKGYCPMLDRENQQVIGNPQRIGI